MEEALGSDLKLQCDLILMLLSDPACVAQQVSGLLALGIDVVRVGQPAKV